MFDMVNRVEHAAYFSAPSFLDYVALYKQNYTTIVKACKIDIAQEFYEFVTPKAPLDISIGLCGVGNTSFTTQIGMSCGGSMKPSMRVQNMHTLIHRKENKVEELPEWWMNRFQVPEEKQTDRLNILHAQKPQDTFSHSFGIPLSDTDISHMTRCASYLRYFIENASIASKHNFYGNVQSNFHEFHLKRMTMLYISPSYWGDWLESETWQDDHPLTLHCQITSLSSKQPVWYAKMELFPEVFGLDLT